MAWILCLLAKYLCIQKLKELLHVCIFARMKTRRTLSLRAESMWRYVQTRCGMDKCFMNAATVCCGTTCSNPVIPSYCMYLSSACSTAPSNLNTYIDCLYSPSDAIIYITWIVAASIQIIMSNGVCIQNSCDNIAPCLSMHHPYTVKDHY